MGKFYVSLCSVVIAAFALGSVAMGGSAWESVKQAEGISVFTKEVPGSDFDEFKGVAVIDAPMEVVNNVLDDVPALATWMPNCIVSKLISKKANVITIYYELKTPWPLSNRDVVFYSKVIKKKDKIFRPIYATTHPAYPPKKGKVRMTDMVGKWVLTRKGNKTHAVYQIKSDPAGNIPAGIANMGSKELPFQALQGLRRMVKKPKYQ